MKSLTIFFVSAIAAMILISLFLNGCVSEKKRNEICAACPKSTLDTIITATIIEYRDTVVYKTIKGDTVQVSIPCPIDKFERKKTVNGLTTTLKSDGKVISADCDADSLRIEIMKLNKFVNRKSSSVSVRTIEVEKNYTGYDHFTHYWFWITIAAIALYITLKVIRK